MKFLRDYTAIASLSLTLIAAGPATGATFPDTSSAVRAAPSATAEGSAEPDQRHEERLLARGYLLFGEKEASGYGSYSYLLFGEAVNDDNRARYQAAVSAHLAIPEAGRLHRLGIAPDELTVAYLPLLESPPDTPSVAWLLEHYDYARAQALIGRFQDQQSAGPYVISSPTPLYPDAAMDPERLAFQDLSAIPEDRIYVGIVEFLAQEREPVRGNQRLTGRSFLPPGKSEASGYGLYSYVLLGAPLNDGNRDLYEAVLSAYLAIEEVSRFERLGVERTKLNVTYLPLREPPPAVPTAAWLLAHYDFARAQTIITRLGDLDIGRPYIASYAQPLSRDAAVDPTRVLLQDLSAVPDDLAYLWVKEFIAQARRPQYWDAQGLRRFMLSLRKNIAIFSRAFQEVRSAYDDIGSLFEKRIRIFE